MICMPKPSEYQEKVREGNRMMILSLLKEDTLRFSELQDYSGMSPRGLAKILQDLEENELIGRALKGRWPAYQITKKGMSLILNTMTMGIIIDQIKKQGGKYFHDYSGLRPDFVSKGVPLGIKDDVVIDKSLEKQLAPILRQIVKNTQNDIFDKFQDGKILDVDPMKLIDKKIVIGFAIDCHNLLKTIKETSFMMLQEEFGLGEFRSGKKGAKQK